MQYGTYVSTSKKGENIDALMGEIFRAEKQLVHIQCSEVRETGCAAYDA